MPLKERVKKMIDFECFGFPNLSVPKSVKGRHHVFAMHL